MKTLQPDDFTEKLMRESLTFFPLPVIATFHAEFERNVVIWRKNLMRKFSRLAILSKSIFVSNSEHCQLCISDFFKKLC